MFSFVSKPLSFLIVLPLILNKFSTEEIALWYLFGLIASFQSIADFGFDNTFVRVISYTFGGADEIKDYDSIDLKKINPKEFKLNTELLKRIVGVMNYVYLRLAIIVFLILLFTTYFIQSSIVVLNDPIQGWVGWAMIVIVTSANFYGRIYSNFLFGLNKVALVRRVEGFFSVLGIIASFIVLFFDGSFMLLVIVHQSWMLNNIIRNWYLARNADNGILKKLTNTNFDREIFSKIWGPSWRGGISSLASQGVIILSGIIYSQYAKNAALLAEYLITLRFYAVIKGVSQAPFYSKIPLLAKLRAQGDLEKWLSKAKRGMTMGNFLMVSGIVGLGITGDLLFDLIDSSIDFPSLELWGLMGFAYLLQRYGAMHTQLYMTTNKVNNHISDSVSGALFLCISLLLFNQFSVFAFPIGMIFGYGLFYCEYAAYFSFKVIPESFWKFESRSNLIPFMITITYLIIIFL
tara:strand:- start:7686 stop:9071 length:1386 start_codon:yes stop_codon:yes gene_type:complete